MTSTRRLWIYGLLLLLSALGVGGLAIGLLVREQERLAGREKSAYETRSAAVSDRARIIAENIELLVGDAQNALMTTLKEAPADEPRPFLTEWQTYNPLVREVFRATASGRPVWGAGNESLRDWLVGTPWKTDDRMDQDVIVAQQSEPELRQVVNMQPEGSVAQVAETQNRGEISQNVLQYQNARRSLEEVAKVKSAPASSEGKSSSFGLSSLFSREQKAEAPAAKQAMPAKPMAPFAAVVSRDDAAKNVADTGQQVGPAGITEMNEAKDSDVLAQSLPAVKALPVQPVRTGWAWSSASDGAHRFGWRELPDGTIIGLELRLEAVNSRLRDVFPANLDAGEVYQLRDAAGHVWEGRETALSGAPLLTIPLSGDVLPGWTIAAYLDGFRYGSSSTDGGFLMAGTAIVALLVGAILFSGALLLFQARRSEIEAAQKTSFVANVSHEFKTPLTTIRLYSELLAEGRVRDESKRIVYLNTIGLETQRLARLVGNVLDFSKLEQGHKKFDRQLLDVAAELSALLDAHAPRLAEAGLTLHTDIRDGSCSLATDRDALQQIVLNLLDNACKYAAEGGEVGVALVPAAAGGVVIRVSDRGPGVPTGQRERIFEKFRRLDDRLTTAHAGTGLGLSIARQLARGLGGDLRCIERAGGGAEFILNLPV